MAHKNICVAIVIIIARGDTHRAAKIRRPRIVTHIGKRAIAIVTIRMVDSGIVRDIQIQSGVPIEVAEDCLHASAPGRRNACLGSDIGERAIAVVPVEDVVLRFKDMRVQRARHRFTGL